MQGVTKKAKKVVTCNKLVYGILDTGHMSFT